MVVNVEKRTTNTTHIHVIINALTFATKHHSYMFILLNSHFPLETRTKRAAKKPGKKAVGNIYHHYYYLKKNQTTPRPSEHPPVMGEKMSKRLGGIKRLQIQNLFMAFKQVPLCR